MVPVSISPAKRKTPKRGIHTSLPMADKYPSISPYAYCAWNPVKLVDPDGLVWKDIDGNVITDHSKIKVYIFYDPKSFRKQTRKMYERAIAKYGAGSVALSDVTTEREFAQDWHEALHLDYENEEYISSTETGKTQSEKHEALNVSDLPSITGNIRFAQLNINSCHSNLKDESLTGSKLTLMESFYKYFRFRSVRGTTHGVSYSRITGRPIPGCSWWPLLRWDYLPKVQNTTNIGNFMYYKTGGMK